MCVCATDVGFFVISVAFAPCVCIGVNACYSLHFRHITIVRTPNESEEQIETKRVENATKEY